MGFQISALRASEFEHLFGLDDEALRRHGVLRQTVDVQPGYPCRISLEDASPGESVLLLNYEHQPAATPYRAAHAIFVREHAKTARPDKNAIPESLRLRLLSLRGFDATGVLIDADVVHGSEMATGVEKMFENPAVSYLHVHNAKPGCYAARVDRA